MRPLDFPFLTDENIAADVVAGLRARGCDVRSAAEERLIGVLERAAPCIASSSRTISRSARLRCVAAHHSSGLSTSRPGHISAAFVLAMIDALRESSIDVQPPFVVVAERRETSIRVRARTTPPW